MIFFLRHILVQKINHWSHDNMITFAHRCTDVSQLAFSASTLPTPRATYGWKGNLIGYMTAALELALELMGLICLHQNTWVDTMWILLILERPEIDANGQMWCRSKQETAQQSGIGIWNVQRNLEGSAFKSESVCIMAGRLPVNRLKDTVAFKCLQWFLLGFYLG